MRVLVTLAPGATIRSRADCPRSCTSPRHSTSTERGWQRRCAQSRWCRICCSLVEPLQECAKWCLRNRGRRARCGRRGHHRGADARANHWPATAIVPVVVGKWWSLRSRVPRAQYWGWMTCTRRSGSWWTLKVALITPSRSTVLGPDTSTATAGSDATGAALVFDGVSAALGQRRPEKGTSVYGVTGGRRA